MSKVSDWLQELGFGHLSASFEANGVDLELAAELTNDDLKDLGVSRLADRRRLLKAAADLAAHRKPGTAARAERRQITVAFVDLVGSTELAGRLDPEDYHDVLRAYHDACSTVVVRYDGHVAQLLGDGILIHFGYPRAHEDDARRAILASLDVQEAIGALAPLPDVRLSARIGIATGVVVVADIVSDAISESRVISGETPNLASRLQTVAEPGTVVVADATRRLVGDLFRFEDLGEPTLRGIAEPHRVWRVVEEHTGSPRRAPLFGREEEMAALRRRWRSTAAGAGQVVMMSGEPGIGKSHLATALADEREAASDAVMHFHCSPYHQQSALYPVISQLESAAQISRSDKPESRQRKIGDLVERSGADAAAIAPLLADLLSSPDADSALPGISAARKRELTFAAFFDILGSLAQRRPVLLVFEDLHWIDPTTLELLEQMIDRMARIPVMLLLTFRPGFSCPWPVHSNMTTLTLHRLSEAEARTLIRRIARREALSDGVVDEIVARADGVPLFLEELTKTMLEVGADGRTDGGHGQVPTSLHDSLMARLDGLRWAREVVHIAAVLGRGFSRAHIAAVAGMDDAELDRALNELCSAELLLRKGRAREHYEFKHSLIHEIAYQSLVRRRRSAYHLAVAEMLEQRFPDTAAMQPESVARHYSEAGEPHRAIPFWEKAGAQAARRSANREAIAHLERGLEEVARLPVGDERRRLELLLLLPYGAQLLAVHGFASPEVEHAYARARDLCRDDSGTPQLLQVYWGLWGYYLLRVELESATRLGDSFLELAVRLDDRTAQVAAHYALGVTLFYRGDFAPALGHFDTALGLTAPSQRLAQQGLYGQDMSVGTESYRSWALSLTGQAGAAQAASQRALRLAEAAAHDFSRVYAEVFAGQMHHFLHAPDIAEGFSVRAATLSSERGYAQQHAQAMVQLGRTWDVTGDPRGFGAIREGWRAYRSTGAALGGPYVGAWLAEAHARRGETDEALMVIEDILETNLGNGEHYFDAEILRVRGEVLCKTGRPAEAVTSLERALALSARQGAHGLYLRAASSLCRIMHEDGQCADARKRLAAAVTLVDQGADTADLAEARTMLERLETCG